MLAESFKSDLKEALIIDMLEGRLFVVKGVKAADKIAGPFASIKAIYTQKIVDFEVAAESIIKKLENSALIKKLNNLIEPAIQRLPWLRDTGLYFSRVSIY